VDENNTLVAGSALVARKPVPGGRFFLRRSLWQGAVPMAYSDDPAERGGVRAQWEADQGDPPPAHLVVYVIIAVGPGDRVGWRWWPSGGPHAWKERLHCQTCRHELKTPLFTDSHALASWWRPGRHKETIAPRANTGASLTRESERLSHLIDNVLDFARLERGKASYNFPRATWPRSWNGRSTCAATRLDKEKMKLETSFDPELPGLRMDDNGMTLVTLNWSTTHQHAPRGRQGVW